MKKIVLVSNKVFHYRQKVYNYLFERFMSYGYEFVVMSYAFDDVDFETKFGKIEIKNNPIDAIRALRTVDPDYVIVFLHLKDILNLPLSLYCKFSKTPHVFWNKGINIKTPNSRWKNLLYRFFHNIADAIVLYTPNEKKYIKERNWGKLNYAYNTLSFEGLDVTHVPSEEATRKHYEISEKYILLFAATIKPDKKLDELLIHPCRNRDIAVVIAGRGATAEQIREIKKNNNYYYLGEIPFDDYHMNALFRACTLFTIPGDLGLALNQAFYWGKPVVALDTEHSVEAFYLKNLINGYLASNMDDYWSFVDSILEDEKMYREYSKNARDTFVNECHVENMFKGFLGAIENSG